DLDGNVEAGPELVEAIKNAGPEAVPAQLVSSWEIPYLPDLRIPRLDPDAHGELKLAANDRLMELIEPALKLLMPNSSPNVDDPASPSEPASAWDRCWRATTRPARPTGPSRTCGSASTTTIGFSPTGGAGLLSRSTGSRQ